MLKSKLPIDRFASISPLLLISLTLRILSHQVAKIRPQWSVAQQALTEYQDEVETLR